MKMIAKILVVYAVSFGTVYTSTCEPFQISKDNLDSALVGHSIWEMNGASHHDCAGTCMSFVICKSFDYNRNERSCKLNDVDSSSVDPSEFITKKGSIFSDIKEWPSAMVKSCSTRPCQTYQRCYVHGGSYVCRNITCSTYQQLEDGNKQVMAPDKNKFRDKAMVKCDVGYIPSEHEVECLASGEWQDAICEKLSDCKEILDEFPNAKSGLYKIKLWRSEKTLTVNCDMETDGGGWTLFHRRIDGSVDFYRNFSQYEAGFGYATGEFWLGLKYIQELAEHPKGTTDLRLDMTNEIDETGQETFQDFMLINGPSYRLILGPRYASEINIQSGLQYSNDTKFSTFDRDLDTVGARNCAKDRHGAWWYRYCTTANLNGLYVTPGTKCIFPGAEFGSCGHCHGGFNGNKALKRSSMMVRRN